MTEVVNVYKDSGQITDAPATAGADLLYYIQSPPGYQIVSGNYVITKGDPADSVDVTSSFVVADFDTGELQYRPRNHYVFTATIEDNTSGNIRVELYATAVKAGPVLNLN